MMQPLDRHVQEQSEVVRPRVGYVVKQGGLKDEFKGALEAGEVVELAAMCFTGEAFSNSLKNTLQDLSTNPRRRVSLRALVPDLLRLFKVPGQTDEDGQVSDAPRSREYLWHQIREHERSLKCQAERMVTAGKGTLAVEFRVLHMSPSLKLYLINNDVVYEGIYDKLCLRPDPSTATPAASDAETDDSRLLDILGHDSLLTRWSRDDGDIACEIIRRRSELFETLWNTARQLSPEPPLQPDLRTAGPPRLRDPRRPRPGR
ncbi:ATP/GTP-binding protein [Streptomyces sp. NPDC001928]|uniref:ATP/GTP-binding protein n=1 Tax=Streptomyces sp. NPDC001928 TaxID=3154404 RepID=UPI00332C28B1